MEQTSDPLERHAPYADLTDDEARALDVAARVIMRHERRQGGLRCACGDPMGDSIDWTWHLANQTALAVATSLRTAPAAPPPPAGDDERGPA